MATIHRTSVSLRLHGDDLDPDEVSRLLGQAPDLAARKDEVWRPNSTPAAISRTGRWLKRVERRTPGDLDAQIGELLGLMSADLAVWGNLTGRFRADLFCGVFLGGANEGLTLRADTLLMIGARGLSLDFDIYAPGPDAEGAV